MYILVYTICFWYILVYTRIYKYIQIIKVYTCIYKYIQKSSFLSRVRGFQMESRARFVRVTRSSKSRAHFVRVTRAIRPSHARDSSESHAQFVRVTCAFHPSRVRPSRVPIALACTCAYQLTCSRMWGCPVYLVQGGSAFPSGSGLREPRQALLSFALCLRPRMLMVV